MNNSVKSENSKSAKSTSIDDAPELIKFRLLGAVVTFVLIALFGPEILDGSGRVHTTSMVAIPEPPVVPAAPILKPPSPKGTGFSRTEEPKVQANLNENRKTAPVVVKEEKKAKVSAFKKPGWTLQLATFSQPKNAQALRKKLTKTGFNSYSKLLKDSSGKTRYQVFVGPELKKEKLMGIKKQLAAKLKLKDGIIKPYRP